MNDYGNLCKFILVTYNKLENKQYSSNLASWKEIVAPPVTGWKEDRYKLVTPPTTTLSSEHTKPAFGPVFGFAFCSRKFQLDEQLR